MPSSSSEYWDIDGTSLHQLGWSVSTLEGRFNVPPLRGSDVQFANVEGEAFRAKVPGTRTISLAMWLTGSNPATGIPTSDPLLAWNDNWHTLINLFWTPRRQVQLTRRWWLTVGGTKTLVTATAEAQYLSGLEPSMTGRHRATFTVDLKLTKPFFFGPEIATTVAAGSTVSITNPGDWNAVDRFVSVDLVGDLTNPVLTNSSPEPSVVVSYGHTITGGQTITLDVEQFTALSNIGTNRINYVSHSGDQRWFGLQKGVNSVHLDGGGGSGHAVVRFRPPYL